MPLDRRLAQSLPSGMAVVLATAFTGEASSGPYTTSVLPTIPREPLLPAREADKQVHVSAQFERIFVTAILKHHVYSGARPGSLWNVYVKLALSDGRKLPFFVPSEPLLGTAVLADYLDSKQGQRLVRYIPQRWSALHR